MVLSQLLTYMTSALTKVTDRLMAIPVNTAPLIAVTNTGGMQFMEGRPMSIFNLATSAGDVTTFQAGTEDFLDVRTSTYWTKASGSWVSSAYKGELPFLRPYSLVLGKNNGQVYFYSAKFTCHLVDTTNPTP